MRNYIILNGTNSNTINGLLIQELAPISKPLMRTEIEEIDGRDGDIITPLGFSAYDKEITIGLYDNFDINQIIAFFNSEGTVTFSNEPDKYYNYTIYQQIDFERLVRFRTATVTLHCQPFKFATTGESQTLDSGDPVSDEGTNLVLEGSQLAPFSQFDLKGNTEQDGTPTPDSPVAVKVVTGENTVKICGKNLLNMSLIEKTTKNGVTLSYDAASQIITLNGTATARASFFFSQSIPLDGSYTLSYRVVGGSISNTTSSTRLEMAKNNSDWSDAIYLRIGNSDNSLTVAKSVPYTVQNIRIDPGVVLDNYQIRVQFEKNSSATDWEAYQEQEYEVNLYGNLYDKSAAVKAGNTNQNISFSTAVDTNTSYVFDCGSRTWVTVFLYDSSNTLTRTLGNASASHKVEFTTTTSEVKAKLEFYAGSSVAIATYDFSGVEFYKPDEVIELCKIGSLQDYIYKSGSKWYIHKEIGAADLSTLSYAVASTILRRTTGITDMKYVTSNSQIGKALADKYIVRQGSGLSSSQYAGYMAVDVGIFAVNVGTSDTSVNPTGMLYYELATPTDTEITNEVLIEQLDDIYYHAHGYKTRTHISALAATGNVPHIIAATVVGSADGTVTNAGNIYSKPKLTIYGSGDVGVYLNGVQMLQIALGTLGNITIDTDLMEAYTGTIDNLQNRAVTGDYSNFKLAVGANKISFSGSVTRCIVENFSRWL